MPTGRRWRAPFTPAALQLQLQLQQPLNTDHILLFCGAPHTSISRPGGAARVRGRYASYDLLYMMCQRAQLARPAQRLLMVTWSVVTEVMTCSEAAECLRKREIKPPSSLEAPGWPTHRAAERPWPEAREQKQKSTAQSGLTRCRTRCKAQSASFESSSQGL